MPRPKPPYSDAFDDSLTLDVEELLSRFQEADSVRFSDFSAVWRRLRLWEVFLGMPRAGEARRFSRVALATAAKYSLPPYSFQIRAGGLYLMFGFFHSQLAAPPVAIRLALKDAAALEKFLRDAADAGHLDILYVYHRLVAAKAFHYTAMPHFLYFQKQKKQKKEDVAFPFLGRTSGVRDLLSLDLLEELSNVQTHYSRLKEMTAEVGPRVKVIHPGLAPSLEKALVEFTRWQEKAFGRDPEDEDEEDEEDEEEGRRRWGKEASSSRARLLEAIKRKSFQKVQETSKSRRHRQPQAAAEAAAADSSGSEHLPGGSRRWQRPLSLRARTWKSLSVPEKEPTQMWLLSAPEDFEGRRTRGAPKHP